MTHVVDMNHTLIMGAHDVLREQIPPTDVFADLRCEVIPHRAVDDRILIRVFLDGKFIVMPEQAQDFPIGCVLSALQLMPQTVFAIPPGKAVLLKEVHGVDHHILNLFHMDCPVQRCALPFYTVDKDINLRL